MSHHTYHAVFEDLDYGEGTVILTHIEVEG